MKVLILNPPSPDGHAYLREGRCESRVGAQITVPITLAVVATVVRDAGAEPWLRDYMVTPLDRAALRAAAREAELALLVTTTPTFAGDARFASELREMAPGLRIIAWGTLATALPERALAEAPALDAVILGEPELVAADLVKVLGAGDVGAIQAVSGLAWRAAGGGARRVGGPRPVAELDRLPRAARDLLDNAAYREPSQGQPFTVIQVARGCPRGCVFCNVASYHGREVRRRSPASVVAELRAVVEELGIHAFLLMSDQFTEDRAWVLALCAAIQAEGLRVRWFANSRADTFDLELARAMRAAGCYVVSFGAETAAPGLQRLVGKRLSERTVRRAVDACRLAGLRAYVYWMFGLPGEDARSVAQSFEAACRIDADFAAFYAAVPAPGTPLYDWARSAGRLRHTDWRRYEMSSSDALCLSALDAAALHRAVRRANRRYFLRPQYLVSVPGRFSLGELLSLIRGRVALTSWSGKTLVVEGGAHRTGGLRSRHGPGEARLARAPRNCPGFIDDFLSGQASSSRRGSRMRVCFLNPPGPGGTAWHKEIHRCGDLIRTGERWPPTGLAQLAAVARDAGAEVALVDGMLTPREPERVAERVRAGRPELLVVLTSTPTLKHDLAFAAPLGGVIVAIGTHPSARPDDALALGADAVIVGEPEGPLAALLARGLEPRAWEGIEAMVTTPGLPAPPPARVADLDALPLPARDLITPAGYTFPLADGAPFASVQVARGCPFACRFCRTPAFSGRPPRHASVARVMAELRGIHADGIRHVALMADTFTADRAWVLALCEALRAAKLGMSWYVATRPDRLDPELAGAMAAAGCRGVALGIEAASAPQLARMGKRIARPREVQRRAVEAARAAGMFALGYFVLGYPGETRRDLMATLRLALALPLDHAFFHAATPFPGTALFDECLDGGLLTSNDWARYEESSLPVVTTPWLMPEEVHAACRLGQLAFYARPGVIGRELGRTRSLAGLAARLRAAAALVGIGG